MNKIVITICLLTASVAAQNIVPSDPPPGCGYPGLPACDSPR